MTLRGLPGDLDKLRDSLFRVVQSYKGIFPRDTWMDQDGFVKFRDLTWRGDRTMVAPNVELEMTPGSQGVGHAMVIPGNAICPYCDEELEDGLCPESDCGLDAELAAAQRSRRISY